MSDRKIIPGSAEDWFSRAKSNLVRAQCDKPEEVFWEDLCFDAQQAVEKAFKSVLIYLGIDFPYTHDVEVLITLLKNHGLEVPEIVADAVRLTEYAVWARYPSTIEPVTEEDYQEAIRIAQDVIDWAGLMLRTPPSSS